MLLELAALIFASTGMEGPGCSYQFVGRTLQVWNTWRQTRDTISRTASHGCFFSFFDQIPLLSCFRRGVVRVCGRISRCGRFKLKVEETTFSVSAIPRIPASRGGHSIAAFSGSRNAKLLARKENVGRRLDRKSRRKPEPVDEMPAIFLGEELPDRL